MQQANPVLKKLGLPQDARVVILHADDIGMCQATISAYDTMLDFGLVSSAATMVPCSWFPSVARIARARQDIDLGVHLTTTCEWDSYRWGPISTGDPETGMMDDEGYFYRSVDELVEHADPDAVSAEIEAQVKRALDAGIDATHVDVHMGAVTNPKFMSGYLRIALKYKLPPLVFRWTAEQLQKAGADENTIRSALKGNMMLESQGVPLMDYMKMMSLNDVWANRVEQAKHTMQDIKPGLTYFIFHPAADTPELRAIAPDWQARVGDYTALMSTELREFIKQQGIHVIGWKKLRDLMRGEASKNNQ